jgi:hypothetical protein
MIRPWICAVIVCLAIARAMANDYPGGSPADFDYFPGGDYSEWTMTKVITARDGTTKTTTSHRKNDGHVERNGKMYLRTLDWSDDMSFLGSILTRIDEAGVHVINERDPSAKEQLCTIFPMQIGLTWRYRIGSETIKNTIVGKESVEINGKKYADCFHTHSAAIDGKFTEDEWDAPKIGPVKSLIRIANGTTILLTLLEFKL